MRGPPPSSPVRRRCFGPLRCPEYQNHMQLARHSPTTTNTNECHKSSLASPYYSLAAFHECRSRSWPLPSNRSVFPDATQALPPQAGFQFEKLCWSRARRNGRVGFGRLGVSAAPSASSCRAKTLFNMGQIGFVRKLCRQATAQPCPGDQGHRCDNLYKPPDTTNDTTLILHKQRPYIRTQRAGPRRSLTLPDRAPLTHKAYNAASGGGAAPDRRN